MADYHFIKIEYDDWYDLITLLSSLNREHGEYYTDNEINLSKLLKIVKGEK